MTANSLRWSDPEETTLKLLELERDKQEGPRAFSAAAMKYLQLQDN